VADFIGDTNFLPAERVGSDGADATYRLRDTDFTIAVEADSQAAAESAVTLAVRPERAELAGDDQQQDGAIITGTLSNVVYFGTDTIYHLRLDNDTPFRVRAQNHTGVQSRFEPGSAVRVRIPRDAVRVLTD
ncbi:MAG TPA: TOBE domain-containing protein, partial [Arenicellales bacterium]|nr:TOBE domain-containing protein [Arenicellales bacterium]